MMPLTPEETLSSMSERNQLVIPRKDVPFKRSDVVNAFTSAFELIGGIPRLALWAHENPGEFFKLYGKLLPSQSHSQIEQSGNVTVLFAGIQQGVLDGITVDSECNELEATE